MPANGGSSAGDAGLIPISGRSPGGVNGNPLQYSWLENPMDREAWWAIVHGIAKESDMTRVINTFRRLKPTQKSEGFHWKYGSRGLSSPPSRTVEHLSHSVSSWADISEVLGHLTQMQPYEYEYREVRRVNNRQDDEGEGLLQQLCWWQS